MEGQFKPKPLGFRFTLDLRPVAFLGFRDPAQFFPGLGLFEGAVPLGMVNEFEVEG